jgi:sulfite reductase alpha subunit-like flavoprotein
MDIIVAEHKFGAENARAGLCSEFLRGHAVKKVCIKIKEGFFEYPNDKATPIIMIADGIGITGCMAMLQHRKVYDGPFGPALLLFQWPDKASAEKIVAELKAFEAAKVADVVYIFTEEEDSQYKKFQDVLAHESKLIWKLWEDDRTRLYCAGGLGPDVHDEINHIMVQLTIKEAGLRDEEAMAYTARHPVYVRPY